MNKTNKILLTAVMAMFTMGAPNAQTKIDAFDFDEVEISFIHTSDRLLDTFLFYFQADDSMRVQIAEILYRQHSTFVAFGVYYNEQGNFSRATDFFEAHWNIPLLPSFAGRKDVFVLDSTFQVIKYYAVITALAGEEYYRAITLMNRILNEPFIENDEFTECIIYELLASVYQFTGNNVRFLRTLRAGVEKFPTNDFLVFSLINEFIFKNDYQSALEYVDRAIEHFDNSCELISVRGALFAEKGNLEGAVAEYKRALKIDTHCERALEALARHYMVQAQNLRDFAFSLPRTERAEIEKQTLELYQKALPLLKTFEEVLRARSAYQHELNIVLILLRNVYHNLTDLGIDKSAEFEAVEQRLDLWW